MNKFKRYKPGNPNLFLFFALLSSAIVLILAGAHTYNVLEDVLDNSEHSQVICAHTENIRLFDEALTSSALLAASTGNVQWEKRYRLFEQKLDTSINELLRLVTLHATRETLIMVDSANVHLTILERRVFELVRERKLNEAVAIITGSEYARLKAAYSEGLSSFVKLHKLETDRQLARLNKVAKRSRWYFGLVIVLLAIVWLPIERFIRKSRAQMLQQNQELELQVQARKQSESALQESQKQIEKAHDQLQESIKASNVGLWEWNMQTDEVYQSPEFNKQIGYNDDEVQSSSEFYFSHLHPEDAKIVNESLQQLMVGAIDKLDLEYRFLRGDGSYRWMLSRTSLQRDQYGEPLRLLGSHLDITERKKAEEKIKESEEKYRVLAESSPEMIYLIDTKGYVTYVNKVAAAQFRAPDRELVGKHLTEIFPPDLAQRNLVEIQHVIASKSNFQNEVEMAFPTGNRWVDARLTPVFDDKNNVIGVLGLSYDITERKKAEEKTNMLAHAVKNSADSICITDDKYKIIFVNDSFCKVYGFKEEEIVGQPIAIIISMNNLPGVGNDLYSSISKKVTWTGEVLNKRKDGIDFSVLLSLAPLLTDKGELIAVVGVARDITERKQAEEALLESKERFQSLFDNMNEGVALHELVFEGETPVNYRIVDVNNRFRDIVGLSREQVAGKLCTEAYGTSTPPYFNEYVEVATSKTPIYFESYFADMDKHFAISVAPWQDKGFATIFLDISDRKQSEVELGLKNKQLQKTNAEKDKFFSIIAHDLRSPFSGFLGLTEIMVENTQTFSQVELADFSRILNESAKKLSQLLENLLEWAQMQKGSISYTPKELSLSITVSGNMEQINQRAVQKGITIRSEVLENQKVFADERMINTILRNLLSNALKFTRKGGKVTVSSKAISDDMIEISVHDSGVGISDNDIKKLFRIDEKVSSKGTEGEPSTGLGLLLCQEFVEKHGGRIWVESELGIGSTFTFSLPVNRN